MKRLSAKKEVIEILSAAGIKINGDGPYDIKILNENFYPAVLSGGSLSLGETYMKKWWECERLDHFFTQVLSTDIEQTIKRSPKLLTHILLTKIFNRQTISGAFSNAHKHYDIDNDLFRRMLGERMVYTCAYWKNASTLDQAQEHKLDLACKKLKLEPGMHVLDIGCGWGSFAKFAAENYSVRVTGITVSNEQYELGRAMCAGLPVEIKLMDYRALDQRFERIVSLGMFEHVGYKNHKTYMGVVERCLTDDGLFLLQTIGNAVTRKHPDPWLSKYIFPNYLTPSISQVTRAVEGKFIMEDLHNFGTDYNKTLLAWHQNFTDNWDELKERYDETFYRMWTYYLLLCAGSFNAKRNFLWQIVLSKRSRKGGYISVR